MQNFSVKKAKDIYNSGSMFTYISTSFLKNNNHKKNNCIEILNHNLFQ